MTDRLWSLCLSGAAPALPQDWWWQWSLAPAALLSVAGLCGLVARSPAPRHGLAWTGCLLCALAWLSPLCRLGATLAAAHMLQLMVVVAAGALLAPAFLQGRRWPGLHTATLAHAGLLWLWHVPAIYTAILTDPLSHYAAWGLLLLSSIAFWCAVLRSVPARPLAGLLAVLATMAHTGLLGALLTFAGRALYAVQEPGARAWGLAPLADQQLAGLLMWVAGGGAYLAAGAVLTWKMLLPADPGLARFR
jgi:putative membrane protein